MGLIVRSSGIHAAGVYTTAPVKKGSFVVEYTGARISRARADELYEGYPYTYLFGLDDGENVIDGSGIAAFINHSCDPNCETDEIDGRVWIIALRNIKEGEELSYDYCLVVDERLTPTLKRQYQCRCGSLHCRGTMLALKKRNGVR